MSHKTWICGITYGKAVEDVKNNILPIAKYFDGLNIVLHKNSMLMSNEENELFAVLNTNKGQGKIHLFDWIKRYDFSRNRYLFDPLMQTGDFFVVLDSMEKLEPDFCKNDLPKIKNAMIENNLEAFFLHGKGFIFRKNEWMQYQNGTHECIRPLNRAAELTDTDGYQDSSKYFTNTRPLVRDKLHFIEHYFRYYLIDNTMQCLLGTENDKELTNQRWQNRHNFRLYLQSQGVQFNYDDVLEYFKKDLSEKMKDFLNKEKILNDIYRYKILGETDIIDNHDYKNIKKL